MEVSWIKRRAALAVADAGRTSLAPAFNFSYRAFASALGYLFPLKFPGQIRSVYLRRSCAMGAAVAGLSDIDLMVIEKNTMPFKQRDKLRRYFRSLAKRILVLDAHEEIFSESQFFYRYWHSPHFSFRVEEGRRTWQLLYGDDILSMLAPVAPEHLLGGMIAEAEMYRSLALSHEPPDKVKDSFGIRRREYFTFKNLVFLFSLKHFQESHQLLDRKQAMVRFLESSHQELDGSLARALLKFMRFHSSHYFHRSYCASTKELLALEKSRERYEKAVLRGFES